MGVGGKIIPRIRLTSAKDLVEVEAELGKNRKKFFEKNTPKTDYFLYILTLIPLE